MIGELGGSLIEHSQWNELLELLFQMTKSQTQEHRVSSLEIFSSLLNVCGDVLKPHFPVLSQVFAQGLLETNPKVFF